VNRTLYQDAHGLFQGRVPDDQLTEKHGNNVVEAQLWQAEDLPFTQEHPQPMWVVRSAELKTEWHYQQGKRVSETKSEKWVWITTLEAKPFPSGKYDNSDMIAGCWKTMPGAISPSTGLSSMASCMPVNIGRNAAMHKANSSRCPTTACRRSNRRRQSHPAAALLQREGVRR
jgi:hypothetical protein